MELVEVELRPLTMSQNMAGFPEKQLLAELSPLLIVSFVLSGFPALVAIEATSKDAVNLLIGSKWIQMQLTLVGSCT